MGDTTQQVDSEKKLFRRHPLEEDFFLLFNPYPLTRDICCQLIATVYTVACCIHTLSPCRNCNDN